MSVDMVQRDAVTTLLLEFSFEEHALPDLAPALDRLRRDLTHRHASLVAWRAISHPVVTCYIDAPDIGDHLDAIRNLAAAQLNPAITGSFELSRLRRVALHRGASSGAPTPFHYIVRTDVESGWDEELQRWYDEEHMAMLASVPGTVQARRLISLDATPRYYACYELRAPEVLTTAEWLKARATAWSERVRPMFRNTRRTMYRQFDF